MMAHLPSRKLIHGNHKPPPRLVLTVPAKTDSKQIKKPKPKSE